MSLPLITVNQIAHGGKTRREVSVLNVEGNPRDSSRDNTHSQVGTKNPIHMVPPSGFEPGGSKRQNTCTTHHRVLPTVVVAGKPARHIELPNHHGKNFLCFHPPHKFHLQVSFIFEYLSVKMIFKAIN